jgi:hypothetical protein
MTQPPESPQVAEWLLAIDPDASYLKEIERGYYDLKYPEDNGLTVERHVIEQWRFRRDGARRALNGIDLAGKGLDEIAEEYHRRQVAEHAERQRALQGKIRALESGGFESPPWLAREAALSGRSLEQEKEEYRRLELDAAEEELFRLFDGDVREEEARAYWAAAGRTASAAGESGGTAARNTAAARLEPNPGLDYLAGGLVPTPSQVAYAKVMAEAARHRKTRLKAEAAQACKAARAAGWGDTNANSQAAAAVHADHMAIRHSGLAERSKWHLRWQESSRDAMLAWHGQHPVNGQAP